MSRSRQHVQASVMDLADAAACARIGDGRVGAEESAVWYGATARREGQKEWDMIHVKEESSSRLAVCPTLHASANLHVHDVRLQEGASGPQRPEASNV